MTTYPDCTATLTRAERAAPFVLAADPEPLPARRRLLVEWEGERWAETDPATGVTLAIGAVRCKQCAVRGPTAPGGRLRAAESPGATRDSEHPHS